MLIYTVSSNCFTKETGQKTAEKKGSVWQCRQSAKLCNNSCHFKHKYFSFSWTFFPLPGLKSFIVSDRSGFSSEKLKPEFYRHTMTWSSGKAHPAFQRPEQNWCVLGVPAWTELTHWTLSDVKTNDQRVNNFCIYRKEFVSGKINSKNRRINVKKIILETLRHCCVWLCCLIPSHFGPLSRGGRDPFLPGHRVSVAPRLPQFTFPEIPQVTGLLSYTLLLP